MKESFIRNTKFFSSDKIPFTFHLDSASFFEKWNNCERIKDIFDRDIRLGGLFSFCFIDGDHTYEGVKQDFHRLDDLLECGGFLMFDDSSDGSGWDGINKVMHEVLQSKRYELVMKNPNYLSGNYRHHSNL